MLWAGFRAGPRGVTLAAPAITIAPFSSPSTAIGSFVGKTDDESILLLEVFMAVITFTGLLVVAVRAQQLDAEAALEAHNAMLEQRVANGPPKSPQKNRLLEEKQARIDDDLNTARILQESILPTDFSGLSRRPGSPPRCGRRSRSSGDFYDVFPLGRGRLGLVIADVSGKGMAAAFFMAVTRTLLRGTALARRVARRVHRARQSTRCAGKTRSICSSPRSTPSLTRPPARSASSMPATASPSSPRRWQGASDPALRQSAARRDCGSRLRRARASRSLPGEMLFLYTDGVTEASNRAGELFRIQRLMDIAQRFADRSPHDLMLAVIDSVESFSVGTLQADDITCLVVRRNLAA